MKKILFIAIVCFITFDSYAANDAFKDWKAKGYKSEEDNRQGYESAMIYWKYATQKTGKAEFIKELQDCSARKNSYCTENLGYQYYLDGDYFSAYPLLLRHTHKILEAEIEFALGDMFEHGKGVLQNEDKAVYFYKQCASLGEKYCAYSIGLIYSQQAITRGVLVQETAKLAYAWLKISMALGQEKWYPKKGGTTTMASHLIELQSFINEQKIKEADKLASQICSTIPKCIQ